MSDAAVTTNSILIIEDSPSVRRLLDVCLRGTDAALTFAEDGSVGLDLADQSTPDLVILDIGLPGMDGWEVLTLLRSRAGTKETPVLILTAHAQPELAAQAEQGGADAFMTKPFSPSDLRATINKLLGI